MKILTLLLCLTASLAVAQTTYINPAGITTVGSPDIKPDTTMRYKIVADAWSATDDSSKVAYSLDELVKMINLHLASGIPMKNLDVVVALHAGTTKAALSNEAYRKIYKIDNPNLPLLKELKDAGVKMYVCGQSMSWHHYTKKDMNSYVDLSLSAMIVLSTYQLKGYAFATFNPGDE